MGQNRCAPPDWFQHRLTIQWPCDQARTRRNPVIKVAHVLTDHLDATAGHGGSDTERVVRSVKAATRLSCGFRHENHNDIWQRFDKEDDATPYQRRK